ncbi:hypothetical protein [Phenylobacterium sp.]|uniref:hypothetical protein n=1 Tax=Phenylobacterium sp. TaxID=1871053 RepID=UPI002630FB2C|nr:hypothetical protein [Phenylobacterium sp.]
MKDDDAIKAGEGDLARADDLEREARADAREPDQDDGCETCEVEHEGQTYEVPTALKGAFLRHADYTKKTQELAEQRRALEAERAAVAEQGRAAAEATHDRLQLAAIDHELASFQGVDWQAYARTDPQGAQALHGRFQALVEARGRLAQAVAQHEHGRRLREAQEAAQAMAETGRTLAREIPGWSPELAAKLSDYALSQGVTHEELAAASDPRIWKVLHKAYRAEAGGGGGVETAAKSPAVRPAVSVAGAAVSSGGVRDELSTKDWMRRRNEQLRKGR